MSKKSRAVWAIVQHTAGAVALEFPPTPGFETVKEVPLAANEIAMCMRIAQIYSEVNFSKEEIKELLKEAGIATGGALAGAYVAGRAGKVAAKELLNLLSVFGWAIKGAVGGTLTGAIGVAFMKFCELRFDT